MSSILSGSLPIRKGRRYSVTAVATASGRGEGGAAEAIQAWFAGFHLDDHQANAVGCGQDHLHIGDRQRRYALLCHVNLSFHSRRVDGAVSGETCTAERRRLPGVAVGGGKRGIPLLGGGGQGVMRRLLLRDHVLEGGVDDIPTLEIGSDERLGRAYCCTTVANLSSWSSGIVDVGAVLERRAGRQAAERLVIGEQIVFTAEAGEPRPGLVDDFGLGADAVPVVEDVDDLRLALGGHPDGDVGDGIPGGRWRW